MMAGNPTWWSMLPPSQQPSALLSSSPSPHLFPPQYLLGASSLPLNSLADNQELPQSWSQLLLGGDEDRFGGLGHHLQSKKLENWEDQILTPSPTPRFPVVDEVKQDVSACSNFYSNGNEEFQASSSKPAAAWSPAAIIISSPKSCATSLSSSNVLEFSYKNNTDRRNQQPSLECNSTATCGASKKARVQPSSSQPPLKVRKEKLGDRITALHQLVSPFGKTDTASVLLEAIGYIRFLEGQIEALSSPYLGTTSSNMRKQQSVQGESSSVLPEDSGQLLNDICLKGKGAPNQDGQDKPKDLRSRGLCLVPVSCTHHVGSDNGADYWAPAAIGRGF